jgi:nucleotide-binding universal stress UspA family protein
MYQTIVTAIDGSDATEDILDQAADLATQSGGEVIVVHVLETYLDVSLAITVGGELEDREAAARVVDGALSRLRDKKVRARAETTDTDVADLGTALLTVAANVKADLLVLGLHHHSRLSSVFEFPVRDAIANASKIPVLLVPAMPR